MRILITYFSQTGDTKKIARAIQEALETHDSDLKSIGETKLEELKKYDILFLGSMIYAGKTHKSIKDLILERTINRKTRINQRLSFFYPLIT